jgi:CspA family cold shock protein
MKTGVVKFFNMSKGFGFIKPDDGSEDVFVHQNGLVDQISDNDRVSFNVEKGPKGFSATNVKRVS